MKNTCFLGLSLVCLLLAGCIEQDPLVKIKTDYSKQKIDRDAYYSRMGSILRVKYAEDLEQANGFISYLSEHQNDGHYPEHSDPMTGKYSSEISEATGLEFYYTWLDDEYVLTFHFPGSGGGLIYESRSKNKTWEFTEYLP